MIPPDNAQPGLVINIPFTTRTKTCSCPAETEFLILYYLYIHLKNSSTKTTSLQTFEMQVITFRAAPWRNNTSKSLPWLSTSLLFILCKEWKVCTCKETKCKCHTNSIIIQDINQSISTYFPWDRTTFRQDCWRSSAILLSHSATRFATYLACRDLQPFSFLPDLYPS